MAVCVFVVDGYILSGILKKKEDFLSLCQGNLSGGFWVLQSFK